MPAMTANKYVTLLELLSLHTDIPLHDEEGNCFWLDEAGQRLDEDPNVGSDTCTTLQADLMLDLCTAVFDSTGTGNT